MKCRVCGSVARDIIADGYNGLSVRCLIDGAYDISNGCQQAVRALKDADRQRAPGSQRL